MNQTVELMRMKTKKPFCVSYTVFPSSVSLCACTNHVSSTWAAAEDSEAELCGRRGGRKDCFNWPSCLGK